MLHLYWILPLVLIWMVLIWGWLVARAFDRSVRAALAGCRDRADPAPDAGRPLPDAVRRFVARAGLGPRAGRRSFAIQQEGEMRMAADRPWLPFRATQAFAVDRLAFAWVARFRMPPGLPLRVIDALGPRGGWLEARLLDLIPVARARGPSTTKAELMRYLAEVAWCPRAVTTNPGLSFEPRDDGTTRARCALDGVEAHVDLEIDADGDLVSVRGLRPRTTPTGEIDTRWIGRFGRHREIGGVRVPTTAEVAWVLDEGEFVYWRGRVTALIAS